MAIIVYTQNNLEVAFVIAPNDTLAWHNVPKDAINPRVVTDKDIPDSREFRGAWRDVVVGPQIDICHVTAKKIQLERLKAERDAELKKLDTQVVRHLLEHGMQGLEKLEAKRKALINATNALENFNVEGFNDPAVLDQIRRLGTLSPIEE